MAAELLYLDSSAIVKLVLVEAESEPLRKTLARYPLRVSSGLAAVEVRRAVRRVSALPAALKLAEDVLAGIDLLRIDDPILATAGSLEPPLLRSLDHALSVADDLAGFVAYDPRLAAAARDAGLKVLAPGV